jgi:cell division protein FtsX
MKWLLAIIIIIILFWLLQLSSHVSEIQSTQDQQADQLQNQIHINSEVDQMYTCGGTFRNGLCFY